MEWAPNSQDRRRAYAEDRAWFRNYFDCPSCGHGWQDDWCCTCDDDCPVCGTTCSPSESEEIEFDG